MDIYKELRAIREGVILEADTKYDIPKDVDKPPEDIPPTDKPPEDTPPADKPPEDTPPADKPPEDTPPADTGDTPDNKYDIPDTTEGDPTATDETPPEDQTETDANTQPSVGNLFDIDDKSRKILNYKSFQNYRNLRDDVDNLLGTLTETVVVSSDIKAIINICIEKLSELLEKINDYIIYRYNDNSYEVNYKNYMEFLLERYFIHQILEKINDNNMN